MVGLRLFSSWCDSENSSLGFAFSRLRIRRLRWISIGGFLFRMLHFAVASSEPGADFRGIVAERTQTATISNLSTFIDDVKTFGPRRISVVGGVVHIVHTERNGVAETFDEIVGDRQAVGKIARLGVANVIFEVGLHLPFVGGMRLAHVNGQKIRMIIVIVEDLDDVADLATERGSSEAAEDKN